MMSRPSRKRPLAVLRRAAIVPVVAAMTLGSAAPAHALTDVFEGIGFTLNCAGLLISDPDRHLSECGVGEHFNDRSNYPYHHIFETDGKSPPEPEMKKPPIYCYEAYSTSGPGANFGPDGVVLVAGASDPCLDLIEYINPD